MKPRLLIVYKPSIITYPLLEEKLLELLSPVGNFIARRKWYSIPEERVKELYTEHMNKPFFAPLCNLLLGRPITTHVFESKGDEDESWVNYVRTELIGHTNPQLSRKGTFRYYVHKLTGESLEKAGSEKEIY